MIGSLFYCINLKRRPDRLKGVTDRLPKEWLAETRFTTDFLGPVDGQTISGATLKEAGVTVYPAWKLLGSGNPFWDREILNGEIGCSYSHLSCWRRAQEAFDADSALQYVVILEDDVKFDKDTVARLEKVMATMSSIGFVEKEGGWDFLYLGRVIQGGKKDVPTCEQGINRPGLSYCTFGYALSRSGLEKVLDAKFETQIIPVDEFLPALYATHPRPDVAALFNPVLNAFVAEPNLVFQLTKMEAGSDTEASKAFTHK